MVHSSVLTLLALSYANPEAARDVCCTPRCLKKLCEAVLGLHQRPKSSDGSKAAAAAEGGKRVVSEKVKRGVGKTEGSGKPAAARDKSKVQKVAQDAAAVCFCVWYGLL